MYCHYLSALGCVTKPVGAPASPVVKFRSGFLRTKSEVLQFAALSFKSCLGKISLAIGFKNSAVLCFSQEEQI